MKKCQNCTKEFDENKSWEKYCTTKCRRNYHQRKVKDRCKNDPGFRLKKNEYERDRIRKVGRRRDRLKHNECEKRRYREKHGINSDDDLRIAKRGSGTITPYGYRQIIRHGHPNSRKDGAMFEHVFIMSEHIGRPLMKHETVHHKNGMRSDNRIENLELWSKSQPYGQRVEDKIQWCKEYLEQYGYKVIMEENTKESNDS